MNTSNGSRPEIEKLSLKYLLDEVLAEVKGLRRDVDSVKRGQAEMSSAVQAMFVVASRTRRHGSRLARLERGERPATPPAVGADDSGVHDVAALESAMAEMKEFRARFVEREEWWYRHRWTLCFSAIGAILVIGATACTTVAVQRLQQQPAQQVIVK